MIGYSEWEYMKSMGLNPPETQDVDKRPGPPESETPPVDPGTETPGRIEEREREPKKTEDPPF